MKRNRFYMYINTRPAFEALPAEVCKELLLALFDCAIGKEHAPLSDATAELFYKTFAPAIKDDLEAYNKACAAKAEAKKRNWSEAFPAVGKE